MLMPRLWVANRRAYNAKDVAEEYAAHTHLQKPEQAVLNLVADILKNGRMLDIGVGGGRTTYHFAPLVEEYIGIDYAEKMIEACQRKFRSGLRNVSFKLCDATDMSMFRDAYFDFVLASFNCIDYMAHDDRIKTLEEIKRVCKRGGLICFSSHNLLYDKLFDIKPSRHPLKFLLAIYRYVWLIALNKSRKQLMRNDYAIINDGAHNFSLKTYYIKPLKQIEQLEKLQFKNIRIFSLNGKEVAGGSELSSLKDCWVYYLCAVA